MIEIICFLENETKVFAVAGLHEVFYYNCFVTFLNILCTLYCSRLAHFAAAAFLIFIQ